ncbi:MAG: nuclear transport factor 2 family protein [Chitinophagales bacterium]
MSDQTQAVLNHHLSSLGENNLEEIMKDYTEQSEIWTAKGPLKGLVQIRSFFSASLPLLPPGMTKFDITQMIVKDEHAYIAWSSDSPIASIPMGADSFVIKEGKIMLQTVAMQILTKTALSASI